MKSRKDIKFIIYQMLYIFVICVIAIKGADLDLVEVEMKKLIDPGWTYVDTTGKIIIDRKVLADMIHFDSTKYLIVSKEDYNNNPDKYSGLQVINTGTGMGNITDQLVPPNENTSKNPDEVKNIEAGSDKIIDPVFPSNFVQYRQNTVTNGNAFEMIVQTESGNITIPPKSSKSVLINGDNAVTLKVENITKTYSVKENKKPQISFQRLTEMNDDAKVTVLQRNVCYRVSVVDDYFEQLDVKFSGSVIVKDKGKGIYDVTMNAFANRLSFDNYIDSRTSPYSIGFTVSVSDKIAPHRITGQQSFVFGEW